METAIQDWEIITSFALPLIIALLNQKSWSSAMKSWVMFGASAVVVIVQMYLRDELTGWEDPVVGILRVTALTIAFYVGFWKQTGVAPKIERSTYVEK